MNVVKSFALTAAMVASTAFLTATVYAERPGQHAQNDEKTAANYAADDTGRNMRDRNDAHKTADDQKMMGKDTDVLREIRKEVIANKSLSVNAHNVKIIVDDGVVTLRGPVKTEQEKSWIEETSGKIASGYRVVNQLEVKPS